MANSWIDLSPYGMTLMVAVIDPPSPPLPARILAIVGDGDAHGAALEGLGFLKDSASGRWVHLGPHPEISTIHDVFPDARVIPDANMLLFARRMTADAPRPAPAPAVKRAPQPVPDAVPTVAPVPVVQAPVVSRNAEPATAEPVIAEIVVDPVVVAAPDPAVMEVAPAAALPDAPLAAAPVVDVPANEVPVEEPKRSEPTLWSLINDARRLGLNRQSQRVFEGPQGRFIADNGGRPIFEGGRAALSPGLFLRAPDDAQLAVAAEGFVEEMAEGNVLRFVDLQRFASAAFADDVGESDERLGVAHAAVEAAMSRWLARKGDKTLSDSWHAAQRLQGTVAYIGDLNRHVPGAVAATPLPLTIAVQRALGTDAELQGKKVVASGVGVTFAQMPRGANLVVHSDNERSASNIRATLSATGRSPDVLSRDPVDYAGADVVVANLVPGLLDRPKSFDGIQVSRSDLAEAIESLTARNPMGQTVLMLRGGDTPEAREELERVREWIGARYGIEGTVDVAGALHAGRPEADPLRIMAVGRRRPAVLDAAPEPAMRLKEVNNYPDLWSWTTNLVYARAKISDALAALEERAGANLAGTASPDLEENTFQAPYVSMSGIGQASTMVPRNLEGATRDAQARIVAKHGDVDSWIANKLGMTVEQLGQRFSPEQVDAIAMTVDAKDRGRASLNCDETGIGKGRWIAAIARCAVLQGEKVLIVTEKEINFSDTWRDIRHIGAEDDFSPLIINDGAEVVDEATGDVTLRSPKRDYVMERMESRQWPEEHNLVLCTYSQFNKPGVAPEPKRRRAAPRNPDAPVDDATIAAERAAADAEARAAAEAMVSKKSAWLRNAIDADTVVILDECHNAAGESNVSENIIAALKHAGQIVFSSATFAKNAKNMGVYAPLFPPGFDTENIAETLRKGGESMQETLSAMFVKDGVMIRREHDLSKCEFSIVDDDTYGDRNRAYMDRLAPILAQMAYLSGDLQKKVQAQNLLLEQDLRNRPNMGEAQVRRQMKSLQTNRIGFGSPLYNLSRLFICSLLVDQSADEAIKALKEGRKPVILVENTVQALMADLVQVDENGANIEVEGASAPDFKDLVTRVLGQLTKVSRIRNKVKIVEDMAIGDPNVAAAHSLAVAFVAALPPEIAAADEPGAAAPPDWKVTVSRVLVGVAEAMMDVATVDPVVIGAAIDTISRLIDLLPEDIHDAAPALRRLPLQLPEDPASAVQRIKDMIAALPELPVSAIDAVRDKVEAEGRRLYEAGEIERPWRMEEITGRSIEYRDGVISRRPAARKVDVKNRFNSGQTDALIINTAGATGIDLHAGRRFRDQRQRVLIEQQPPADITKQMQAYGRVNRFDQVIGPQIRTLMAGLPMELRLVAMRNAKLRRLSANTTSNRDHSALVRGIPDLMNVVGDAVCSRYAEERPDLMRLLGFEVTRNVNVEEQNRQNDAVGLIEDQKDGQCSANEFLARLAMLSVARQIQTIEELEAEYRATIEELDARGENPLKSKTVEGVVHLRDKTVFEGADVENPLSEFNRPVFAQTVYVEHQIAPMRGDEVATLVERGMISSGGDGIADCADRLDRAKNRVLQTYLPAEGDVATALAAGGNKVLNAMNTRMIKLIDTLRELQPGSSIDLTLDGVVEQAIITKVRTPRPDKLHLAAFYEVEMVAPGWIRPQQLSLHSLLGDENFKLEAGLHGDDSDALLRKFDTALEGAHLERRTILTGNQWTAMSLSIQHKLGSMTAWQDEQGIRHRGVLVSKRHFELDFVPIGMRSVEMACAALRTGKIDIYGSSDLNLAAVLVKPAKADGRTFIVEMPSMRSKKYGGIYQHPPVMDLVRRLNIADGRSSPEFRVGSADLDLVVGHLMDAGARFFIGAKNRDWANKWMTEECEQAPEVEPRAMAA